MATYDHKQVFTDYATGKITPEMAVGHSLQHIDHLYAAQSAANAGRHELQHKVDALEKRVTGLQAAVDRLTAILEKARVKRKLNTPGASTAA